MKKKKLTFLFSIATLCLCFSILAFGVYAAKKASLTTTGSVSFEAHNCKVRVLGSVDGAYDSTGTEKTVTPLTDTDTSQGKPISGDVEWAIGDVYFDDLNCSNDEIATPIVFTFKMTNESGYAVTAEISLSGDLSTKITSTVAFTTATEGETVTSSGNFCVINETKTVTATLTMVPATEEKLDKINLNNLKLKFEKVAEETSLTNFEFTKDTTNKTAKVKAVNTSITTANIPAVFSSGTDLYVVTEIYSVYRSPFYEGAFIDCTSLTSVTIPSTITSICNYAFKGCTSLSSITIPSSVISIDQYAFQGCTSLTSITIPDSVTSIGSSAFSGCTGLNSVTIPNSVSTMSEMMFSGCSSLTSVTIPTSVTELKMQIFSSCTSLTSVTYLGTMAQWNNINKTTGSSYTWISGNSTITQVVCSDGTITL